MSVESGVPFSLTDFVRHHFESGMMALRNVPLWVWPLPFLFAGLILLIVQTPLAIVTTKPVQELIGPSTMIATTLLAVFVHRKVGVFFTLLLACFAGAIFMREWHVWGTEQAIFVALAALAWWASSRREEIIPYLRKSNVGGLLCTALLCYAASQFMDQDILLKLDLVAINDYKQWNDNIEETLETIGHMFIFAAVVMTYLSVARKPSEKASA